MLNTQLTDLVRRDPLTGLLNRRAFFVELEQVIAKGGVLILADVDGFKQINDQLGHAAGDAALVEIGNLLNRAAGLSAVLGRLGGDEFAVLLGSLTEEEGVGVAEKLRKMTVEDGNDVLASANVTLSLGVHALKADPESTSGSLSAVMAAADLALYAAKSLGRNQVVATSSLDDQGLKAPRPLAFTPNSNQGPR